MKKLSCVALFCVLLALPCLGQYLGTVGMQSLGPVTAFTAQNANGVSGIFANLNMSTHLLNFCTAGFAGTISMEASSDGTFATPTVISSATFGQRLLTDTGCHTLQGGGYYATVRARITNYVSGTVSASYTAVASPIAFSPSGLGSNGPTAPIICDQQGFFTLGPSTNGVLVANLAGTTIYVCEITVSFGGATTTGTLSLGGSTGGACLSYVANWQVAITASTPQIFQVGGPLGAFVQEGGGNQQLCAASGAYTATATISISFAQR